MHRPGTELDRLTPANAADLLFDDVMWAERAREEHDAFVEVLRDRGVRVHLFADTAGRGARQRRPDAASRWTGSAPTTGSVRPWPRELRALFDRHRPGRLADYLIGGIAEVRPRARLAIAVSTWHEPRHRRLRAGAAAEHAVPAGQRGLDRARRHRQPDGQAGPPARVDQHPHRLRAPPAVRRADFRPIYGDDDLDHTPATLEGGDIHVLADGVVMIGMGERTTPMGVEVLARRLFAGHGPPGAGRRAAQGPLGDAPRHPAHDGRRRHLRGLPLLRPRARAAVAAITGRRRSATVETRDRTGSRPSPKSLEGDGVRVLQADGGPRAQPRASSGTTPTTSWRSRPAWSLGYDRNIVTNTMLRDTASR